MKILQILPELNVGGVETGTVDLAKYLVSVGHEALVVSNGGPLVDELTKNNIKHFVLPVHSKSLKTVFQSIGALKKIILQEKVDIVHARSRVPGWIAYFSTRGTQAQFMTTCHGHYSKHPLSRIMGWGKLIIVPSRAIGQHMVNNFGVNPSDLRLIPRSVDVSKFILPRAKDNQGRPVIAIVGRITPLKGHIYFLKAMSKVVRNFPYARIWIIGDAPKTKESYKRELELTVKRLGLGQNVEFLGNRRDIPELLSQTDVLVLSTITPEAFGRVILEAQAAGVPVVATEVGGVVDIIDHDETGLLVPPKDSEMMAEAVVRILNDKKLVDRFTIAAKKKIEQKFTLKHMASQTIEVYEEVLRSLNILVIKLSAMGDVILITASLKALREKFPHAKIYCLVGKQFKDILEQCPYLDGIIPFDAEECSRIKNFFKFTGILRRYKFDKIIDFQNNNKSHLLAFLSFGRESYGYKNKKLGFLLSHGIKDTQKNLNPVEHQFQVLKMLGISYVPHDCRLELWPTAEDREYVQKLLESEWMGNAQEIVGIHIGASARWKTKNWPPAHISRLCDLLSAKNIRVFLTGVEEDRELARQILKSAKSKPAVFVGKTNAMQLAALISRCKVFVTPDSAPMHMAAAMKIPLVAFFGPTDSVRHLPPTSFSKVFKRDLPCMPCYSSECRIKTHACMTEITPEEVAKEIEKLVRQKT